MRTARGPLVLAILLAVAFILGRTGVLDWEEIHTQIEPVTGRWWSIPLLIALQAVFYALALPGSAFLIVVPVFYSPIVSTPIVVAGGVMGALLGYALARRMGEDWRNKVEKRRTFKLLKRNSDFLALCAMRVLPGFPHSVINYGSGLLSIPPKVFGLAAAAGFAAKGYLYAVLVHGAVQAQDLEDYIRLESIWPLIVLAALLVGGRMLRRRWSGEE